MVLFFAGRTYEEKSNRKKEIEKRKKEQRLSDALWNKENDKRQHVKRLLKQVESLIKICFWQNQNKNDGI